MLTNTYWQVQTRQVERQVEEVDGKTTTTTLTEITNAIQVFPTDVSPTYLEQNNIRTVVIDPTRFQRMTWVGDTLIPEHSPDTTPRWQEFMSACDVPDRGGNGLLALALQTNFQVASTIVERIDNIVRLGTHTQYDLFWLNYLFSQIVPQMPADKKLLLSTVLEQYHIPIQV